MAGTTRWIGTSRLFGRRSFITTSLPSVSMVCVLVGPPNEPDVVGTLFCGSSMLRAPASRLLCCSKVAMRRSRYMTVHGLLQTLPSSWNLNPCSS